MLNGDCYHRDWNYRLWDYHGSKRQDRKGRKESAGQQEQAGQEVRQWTEEVPEEAAASSAASRQGEMEFSA